MCTVQPHSGAVQAANSVANALLALNSAVNFAIYCLVGKKFRRILRERVLRCGGSKLTAVCDDSSVPKPPPTAAPVPEQVAATQPAAAPPAYEQCRNIAAAWAADSGNTIAGTQVYDEADLVKDMSSHSANHVVVAMVAAAETAAASACSSPSAPSVDEDNELTAPPQYDTVQRGHDLDNDLEPTAATHGDDIDDEQRL